MKNKKLTVILALLTLLFVFLAGCNCNGKPPAKHFGPWVDSSLREAIVFHRDGTFETLKFYDPDPVVQLGQPRPQIPDAKTWKVRDRGKYVIDYTKNPAWIDLVSTVQGTPRRVQGLIKFLDNNTFYVAIDNVRPASIDSSSRKARFTRAAPKEIGPITK